MNVELNIAITLQNLQCKHPSVRFLQAATALHLFIGHFSGQPAVSRYQNDSVPDLIGAKDDGGGGDNWSYKTSKALVKLS